MRQLLTLVLTCLFISSYSQKEMEQSLEIFVLGRFDNHADYRTKYGDVIYTNDLKLYGNNFALGINYRHEIKKYLQISAGLTYYRLSVDKINNTRISVNPVKLTTRLIDYSPDSIPAQHSTESYQYHNAAISLGLYRLWNTKGNWDLITGVEVSYLYTFLQKYQTSIGDYTTNNGRPFAFQVNTLFGTVKRFEKFYLSPRLLLPIFQSIKKDVVFKENPDDNVGTWFSGYGIVLTVGKYLFPK